jgi:hypothetical protein
VRRGCGYAWTTTVEKKALEKSVAKSVLSSWIKRDARKFNSVRMEA